MSSTPSRPSFSRSNSLRKPPVMTCPVPPTLRDSPLLASPTSIFRTGYSPRRSAEQDERWLMDTVPVHSQRWETTPTAPSASTAAAASSSTTTTTGSATTPITTGHLATTTTTTSKQSSDAESVSTDPPPSRLRLLRAFSKPLTLHPMSQSPTKSSKTPSAPQTPTSPRHPETPKEKRSPREAQMLTSPGRQA